MTRDINWHYPRKEIAENILELFDSGSTHAITIFAPRRMGKTSMLIEDLWPLAEKHGYDVRYTSFWLDKDNPQKVFLDTISKKSDPTMIKARLSLGGSFLEATKRGDKDQDTQKEITVKFEKLSKKKKKVILLLDEIQELAVGDQHENFVATLRTLLDTYKKNIYVVFTGSSQSGLLKMFKKQKAPLFNFSHQMDLPELGAPFVKHMIEAFQRASGKNLNLAASLRVFTRLHKVPARFHDLLRAMLIAGRIDIEDAFSEYESSGPDQQRFYLLWKQLKPLDKQLLLAIAKGVDGLFSAQQLKAYANELGIDNVSRGSVQKSIERLKASDAIESFHRGQYEFVEMAFKDFTLNNTDN